MLAGDTRAFDAGVRGRRKLNAVSLAGKRPVWLHVRSDEQSREAVAFLRFLDAAGALVLERRLSVSPGQEAVFDLGAYGLDGIYDLELVSFRALTRFGRRHPVALDARGKEAAAMTTRVPFRKTTALVTAIVFGVPFGLAVPASAQTAPAPAVSPGPGPQARLQIDHDPLTCITTLTAPLVEAKVMPGPDMAASYVYFRAAGTPYFYYVVMAGPVPEVQGILPRPLPETRALDYFLQATDRASLSRKTTEWNPPVVPTGVCKVEGLAVGKDGAGLTVGMTDASAPVLPPGFRKEDIAKVILVTGAVVSAAAALSGSSSASSGSGAGAGAGAGAAGAAGAAAAGTTGGGTGRDDHLLGRRDQQHRVDRGRRHRGRRRGRGNRALQQEDGNADVTAHADPHSDRDARPADADAHARPEPLHPGGGDLERAGRRERAPLESLGYGSRRNGCRPTANRRRAAPSAWFSRERSPRGRIGSPSRASRAESERPSRSRRS